MTDREPEPTGRRSAARYAALFESVTGTSTIREPREDDGRHTRARGDESPESIETYLDETLAADGLTDVIEDSVLG